MKVKRLHLQNYGRFEDLKIDFAPTAEKTSNVTVIVGNNGAGKSQILQALAKLFDLFLIEVKNLGKENNDFDDDKHLSFAEVKNGADHSQITLFVEDENKQELRWDLIAEVSHYSIGMMRSSFEDGVLLNNMYSLNSPFYKFNLPIIVSYSVNRMTESRFNQSSRKNFFEPYDGYIDALNAKIDFDVFVKWFRHREDIENAEIRKAFDILLQKTKHEGLIKGEGMDVARIMSLVARDDIDNDIQLSSTIHAIKNFLGSFESIWIDRESEPQTMSVLKDSEKLDVNQLSQGEKSLLALVGDIARRLALLNPSLDNPLEGEGVVMIDEVDLHLHPKWQHDLIDKLVKTFPNVQFILTTHSPHVISDRNDILLYSLDDGELSKMPNVYGEDVNTVLTKIFDVDIRDSEVEKQFTIIRRAISNHEYSVAESNIERLAEKLPSDHLELLKCRLLLAQAKLKDSNTEEPRHAED